EIASAPVDGLNDITFPFNMAKAPHKSGFFFAQEFSFNYVDNVGHTGLQPREDKNGVRIVKAVFSSFIDGTTTDPNCQSRADGGPGVICAVDVEYDYSHTYNLVKNAGSGMTWKGTLVDETGYPTDVGEWTLPEGAGKLVTLHDPTSEALGTSGGEVLNTHEDGDCIGKVAFSAEPVTEGIKIRVGF
ncbi:hypothetical protein BG005_001528, partial [Podila minutissima]